MRDVDDCYESDKYHYFIERILYEYAVFRWRGKLESGSDSVPFGFTTYFQNALEARWRTIKAAFDKGFVWKDGSSLIVEVCRIFRFG